MKNYFLGYSLRKIETVKMLSVESPKQHILSNYLKFLVIRHTIFWGILEKAEYFEYLREVAPESL